MKSSRASEIMEASVNTFMGKYDSLLANHEGEWIVFNEGENTDTYHAQEEALKAGYGKFGNVPFLVRQITREYQIYGKYGSKVSVDAAA